MRFTRIDVRTWRTFRNISLDIPPDGALICLVGENGTGKTSLFELIAACANRFGITPGSDLARGDPFSEPHDISVVLTPELPVNELIPDEATRTAHASAISRWDGTLRIDSRYANPSILSAGPAYGDPQLNTLAQVVVAALQRRSDVHYLSLDADRSYPHVGLDVNSFAQAILQANPVNQLKQRSFARASSLYGEWERNVLADLNRAATRYYNETQAAIATNGALPVFPDILRPYKDAVESVLPHLHFLGANSSSSALIFDTGGTELMFSRLSGGEREIAFIIGQIDRFRLRSGLLLIDEPELHLNPDLVRNWVSYLRSSVENGQVWIATHSMEAVEAAGAANTFVLDRDPSSRIIDKAFQLSSQPIVSTLSAALGTPGFSITSQTFFFVEGEKSSGEAQRFYDIFEGSRNVRFIEAGNGREVSRKVNTLTELAEDSARQVFAGGILDRDFKDPDEITRYERQQLHVLSCHEIENCYLHPPTLQAIITMTRLGGRPEDVVVAASDEQAGRWIIQRATYLLDYSSKISRETRVAIAQPWHVVDSNQPRFAITCAQFLENDKLDVSTLESAIVDAISAYSTQRKSADLWMNCFGKECAPRVAAAVGLTSDAVLFRTASQLWKEGRVSEPAPLSSLRRYVESASAR